MSADWLDEVKTDGTAMAEVKKAVDRWRELKFKKEQAEEALKYADKVYQEFCNDVVSKVFRKNGLESLKLDDGSEVSVVGKVRCSILKGKQGEVANWLREHGADNLVTSELIVMPSNAERLKAMGIAYDEETSMNTNSVKAWVKGEMEVGNIDITALPSGLSWYMYDEIMYKE